MFQFAGSTASAFSKKSQRLFLRVNEVYDWERHSHSLYDTFPVDIFYPYIINTGALSVYGRILMPDVGANLDNTIAHEFGHEVFYRRMLGASTYNYYHQQAAKGNGTPPICSAALSWGVWKNPSQACVAPLEGFALWFETVATGALNWTQRSNDINDYRAFPPEDKPSGRETGTHVVGRVAQMLIDMTDSTAVSTERLLPDRDVARGDSIRNPTVSLASRYIGVARYFHDANVETSWQFLWNERIKPRLPSDQWDEHCATMRFDTVWFSGAAGCNY